MRKLLACALLVVSIGAAAAVLNDEAAIGELKLKVNQQDEALKQTAQTIKQMTRTIKQKDEETAELKRKVNQQDEVIKKQAQEVKHKRRVINQASSPIKTAIRDLVEKAQACVASSPGFDIQNCKSVPIIERKAAANEGTAELGESKKGFAFDWSQCRSEGGNKECARCAGSGNGMLPCNQVKPDENADSNKYSSCPDDKIFQTRKFFSKQAAFDQLGECKPLDGSQGLSGIGLTSYSFPGTKNPKTLLGGSEHTVYTKVKIMHPSMAQLSVGGVLFKRMLSHVAADGKERADVFKIGLCVDCKNLFQYQNKGASAATDDENKKFVNDCLPHVFDAQGKLKSEHECRGKDATKFKADLQGF